MHHVPVAVCLLLLTPVTCWCAASSNQSIMDINSMCRRSRRGKIHNICNNKPVLRRQIELGIAAGQAECQHQFRHRRWNCTSSRKGFKKVMLRDTRETGFVNAILAAGIAYQVTRACTSGELLGCACNKKMRYNKVKKKTKAETLLEGEFQWEGCRGENIEYGIKKSKDFLDFQLKQRPRGDMKTQVKLHNYIAGRLAIKNNMRKECKCHGLSGSCTLKTCLKKMPPFREVGNKLKERFDGAVKVIAGNDGKSFMPEGSTIKLPGKLDLVYSEKTPDYCDNNSTIGSFGTRGRECNATSIAEEGCGILCCNRGFQSEVVIREVTCNCTFVWCCEVKCAKCHVPKSISTCL
ncbi:protein Wnt-6 isoform X2 [Aethina tumida]|uniref:protein Wnt-6 isoform X2 n=1 Tax=Aethina tumida TaxID=116153 RepID=UPI00096B0DC1|nr:protein Wnt-6 isoform X2 [Aethina tumida]